MASSKTTLPIAPSQKSPARGSDNLPSKDALGATTPKNKDTSSPNAAAFQYLTTSNVKDVYVLAKQYTEALTYPWFLEYERIARNEPHPSIDKKYPKTTDGTTASVIRKTPHRVIQQIPTGSLKGEGGIENWLTIVAKFIYEQKIVPHANAEYNLIQKCWSIVEKSMTFGSVTTYTPFLKHDDDFGPDLSLIYWGDVMIQPGKLSDKNAHYIFIRSWWQQADIKALIAKENRMKANSKTYEGTWDTEVLQSVLDFVTTKDIVAQTPVEREKAVPVKGAIELITGFQRGVGSKFYTFAPTLPDGNNICRTKVNKDPRGEIPVSMAYFDADYSNPLGRGVVEMVGGLQNLMDAEMQMYQYNRALMLNPPIVKIGNFNKNRIKFEPNIIIDAGSDPTAKVEPMVIDTTAVEQFPANYGLMKSQLLNLLQSPNTDISAGVGNTNSKTPQGVNMSGAILSVDDNYVRKQFEQWFERWSETAINLYFAEKKGIEVLQLDENTADTLRNLDGFDLAQLSADNKIKINYDTETPVLHFTVDPSSSQMKDDPTQLSIIANTIEMVMKFPQLNKRYGGTIIVDELSRRYVRASAIQDPEQIAPEATAAEKKAQAQNKTQISGFSPLFDKPKIAINYSDVEDPQSRAQILQLAGAPPANPLAPESPAVAANVARQSSQIEPEEIGPNAQPPLPLGQAAADNGQLPPPTPPIADQITPDHLLKAQQQDHQQVMDKAKLALEVHKTNNPAAPKPIAGSAKPGAAAPPQASPAPPPQFVTPPEAAPSQPTKAPQPPAGITPSDQPVIQALQKSGATPQQVGVALAMIHHGYNEQQILAMLSQGGPNGR